MIISNNQNKSLPLTRIHLLTPLYLSRPPLFHPNNATPTRISYRRKAMGWHALKHGGHAGCIIDDNPNLRAQISGKKQGRQQLLCYMSGRRAGEGVGTTHSAGGRPLKEPAAVPWRLGITVPSHHKALAAPPGRSWKDLAAPAAELYESPLV